MSMPVPIRKYLDRHADPGGYALHGGPREGIDQIVVIPALAERDHLFFTLATLSRGERRERERTLVVTVVNNGGPHACAAADIENNGETIRLLRDLIQGNPPPAAPSHLAAPLGEILHNGLRLAVVDASSPGWELPDRDGGVGLARKIGLDGALRLFDYSRGRPKLLLCLDADTLVEEDYLSAVRAAFAKERHAAAVIAFAHQEPQDPVLCAAICCYETFLRYYILGLTHARSPYAFHSIGSAMACTAEAYAAVRGMSRRRAAEDFYFLDKLAKIGLMGRIRDTTVHPAARPSQRVPFGTGRRILRFLEGGQDEYRLYDPRIFQILGGFIGAVVQDPGADARQLLAFAGGLHPVLRQFLERSRFALAWGGIRRNFRQDSQRLRHFHSWFDGFRTLRLIHDLTEGAFPPVPMYEALPDLLQMAGLPLPAPVFGSPPPLAEQRRILHHLRLLS